MRTAASLLCLLLTALPPAFFARAAPAAQAAAQTLAVPDAAVARFESTLGIAGLVDNHDVPVFWLGRDGAFAFARTEAGARRWFLVEAGETEPRPLSLPGGTPVLAVTGGTAAAPVLQTPDGPVRLDRATATATPVPTSTGAGFVRHLPLFDQRVPTDIANPVGGPAATIVDGKLALRGPGGDVRVLAAADAPAFGWDLEAPGPLGGGQGVSPWSPDGKRLYAARLDRRAATSLPVLSTTGTWPSVSDFPVWMAGKPLPGVFPDVVDPATGARVALKIGDTADAHVRFLGWSADSRSLWLLRASRTFDRVEVLRADAGTSEVRILHTETSRDGGFVRMLHDFIYGGPVGFHPLAEGFLWLSEKDGWNHLYRHDASGRQVARLTSGSFPIVRILGVDEARNLVLVQAAPDPKRPADWHAFRLPLSGGRMVRLAGGAGDEKIRLSPTIDRAVITRSTPDAPGSTRLVGTADGKLLATLATPDISRLKARGWTAPEAVTARVASSPLPATGVLYRPADFDPGRRYPVVEYVYGGPQTRYAPAGFTAEAFRSANLPQALAELGFVVVILDTPGTPGRSRAWHQFTKDGWGKGIVDDHAAAVQDLARTRPWMDMARVGVFGHSWGGYHAFMGLALRPDVYKAAVSSGPGFIDAVSAMDEAYLGDPAANAERFARIVPFQYADRIRPDTLMLMSGTVDQFIWPMTLRMSDQLLKRGIRHQVVPLPDQGHGFSPAGYEYATRRIADFFVDRLLGAPAISWQLPPAPAR
jgi:dipeptidyl aminopeptidase/acylaminoacyl peptidase